MQIIRVDPQNPDLETIKKAAGILKNGGVIIYPTDTCYGIGALVFDEEAVKKIYLLKKRSFRKPLSIIVSDLNQALSVAYLNEEQIKFFRQKLPGPYTLVFKKKKILPDILTGGKDSVGVRIPDYLITNLLSKYLSFPYTTTSANISGKPPTYSLKEIWEQFGKNNELIDLILDAGYLPKRKPSTVIDLTQNKPKILR